MRAQIVMAAILLAIAAPAAAQQQAQCPHRHASVRSPQIAAAKRQMHNVCEADIAAYCISRPACMGVVRCLDTNRARLSAPCSGALAELRAVRRGTVPN
jgi:hypothetical protein